MNDREPAGWPWLKERLVRLRPAPRPGATPEVVAAAVVRTAVVTDSAAALPADWAAGYGGGWHAYLDRLEAHLAGVEPPDWAERMAALKPLYADPDDPA